MQVAPLKNELGGQGWHWLPATTKPGILQTQLPFADWTEFGGQFEGLGKHMPLRLKKPGLQLQALPLKVAFPWQLGLWVVQVPLIRVPWLHVHLFPTCIAPAGHLHEPEILTKVSWQAQPSPDCIVFGGHWHTPLIGINCGLQLQVVPLQTVLTGQVMH